MDKTIIYYTANKENPIFEQKIIDDMLSKKGDRPLISVSQKPMNLGKNICVGERGHSYINEWRQILSGAKEAKTEYLVMAESDVLYSPEYFQFEPKGENIYRYNPIWLMWLNPKRFPKFYRKRYTEGAQIVKREYFIKVLEDFLKNYPGWYDESFKNRNPHSPYYKKTHTLFHGKIPCISIKSFEGENRPTGFERGEENSCEKLPYWGDITSLRERFIWEQKNI